MSRIAYSMAGEGRGHATRARAAIEELRKKHEITVYAPGEAFHLLEPLYKNTDVKIKRIPGLFWKYNSRKKLSYPASAAGAISYLAGLPCLINGLRKELENSNTDMVITDFDPSLPRAAKSAGIPFISFDHQHFLTTYDLSSLPCRLQLRASFMEPAVNLFYSGQIETIVSSFYFPPVRKNRAEVKQIGVLLGKEVLQAQKSTGNHIVVYIRKFAGPEFVDALKNCGCDVRVYGLGNLPSTGRVSFHEINLHSFVEDLSSSRGLITTAGNQVVGEALYLEKPVLAIPEPGNFEQEINAHFLEKSGAGITLPLEMINANTIKKFLDSSEKYKSQIDSEKLKGNHEAVSIIEKNLANTNKPVVTGIRIPAFERAAL